MYLINSTKIVFTRDASSNGSTSQNISKQKLSFDYPSIPKNLFWFVYMLYLIEYAHGFFWQADWCYR